MPALSIEKLIAGNAKDASQDVCRVPNLGVDLGSESLNYLFFKAHQRGNATERTEVMKLLAEVAKEDDVRKSLVMVALENPGTLNTAHDLKEAIAFHRKYPNWWGRNVEARMQSAADSLREQVPEGSLRLRFDMEVGAAKGVYGFAKGLVMLVPDVIEFAGKLATEEQTQKAVLRLSQKVTVNALKLRFGSFESKKEALNEINAAGEMLWNQISTALGREWDEAAAEGKEAEVVTKWATRGILEVATVCIGWTKGAQAAKTVSTVAKEVQTGVKATEMVVTTVKAVPEAKTALTLASDAQKTQPVFKTRILKRYGGKGPTVIYDVPVAASEAAKIPKGDMSELAKAVREGVAEAERAIGRPLKQVFADRKLIQDQAFARELQAYAAEKKLTAGKPPMIEPFREGMSVFMSEDNFVNYVVKSGYLGYSDNTQYMTSLSKADDIVKLGGNSADIFAKRLGFDADLMRGQRFLKLDVDFTFSINPRLPSGLEGGANKYFKYGGFTSGGMPEIVIDRIPVSKISRVTLIGELK